MGRVKPGDGRPLQPYRWWQLFARSLFHIRLAGDNGASDLWSVDVRHGGDSNGVVHGELYRNRVNETRAKLPAAFPVPGGTIEVAASSFGLKRCHFVGTDGTRRQLTPDPASAEGRRAHLGRARPVLSRAIGLVSGMVLVVGLLLGVPQIVEQITRIPFIAGHVGVFVSPIALAAEVNVVLVLVSVGASVERALRLRYNRLLDGGIFDGDD
ncbi:hypothetical protein CLV46_1017 [Diaminobutyricimonas aerilata]|uniref:Uncharacterized protein n=1 Tax=Diaminobutyricimonas aerilata TaxID=1162967 RepID=A0A2M9CHX4_9MICO|nr:hypothetical protein [Diaminobutyricimonas aerilata]PJJ71469.1 hypothetical protein CLV46_1017 [Diaminobutyricimonas aerilata]